MNARVRSVAFETSACLLAVMIVCLGAWISLGALLSHITDLEFDTVIVALSGTMGVAWIWMLPSALIMGLTKLFERGSLNDLLSHAIAIAAFLIGLYLALKNIDISLSGLSISGIDISTISLNIDAAAIVAVLIPATLVLIASYWIRYKYRGPDEQ